MEYMKDKVVAVLVIKETDSLIEKIERLIITGYTIFEVTLRTDVAFDAISIIKDRFSEVKVGAGTILTCEQAEKAKQTGADFGVSPGFNEKVYQYANKIDLPFIPGVVTPSEIEIARSQGAKILKLFPAKLVGGVEYLKALNGPYKDILFMPTGGIKEDTVAEYMALDNVLCVGGTWMN